MDVPRSLSTSPRASSNAASNLPALCEGVACQDLYRKTWYCVLCDCSFCDLCWDKQPSHKPKKRGVDGLEHEKIDKLVVERYRSILEPSSNSEEQDALHKDDEDTTWFGVDRDKSGDPIFEDYGRFAALMLDSLSEAGTIRRPQLVSFIGQTGIICQSLLSVG